VYNLKFSEFKYERPNYDEVKKEFNEIISKIDKSETYEEQLKYIKELNNLRNTIDTMGTIASIKYSINTADENNIKEKNYWDENSPLYEELNSTFYKSMVNSKFKNELTKEIGEQFFKIAEFNLKSFSSEIIEELKEENKLTSEYTKLLASCKINFQGKERNLSQMSPFMQSKDRNIRKEASDLYYKFFETNEEKFDELYDKLVKVRDKMAKKLGFDNFVELGYIRMFRTDYNAGDVSNFRKQVLEHIVPVANKLYKRQAKRLNISDFKYIDEPFEFESGNATPKGSPEFILQNGIKMYSELSDETKEFFEFMMENELLDVLAKKNKGPGGYCTYIANYKSPFIFSNFNSTSDDIDVLTHEAGHAFQVYMSRHIEMPELNFPTYESCEIHSMSMEFITWPWMNLFFEEDTEKYKFAHLGSAIKFIPYGIVVDEFQHLIYENPTASYDERKKMWRDIEKKYLPHKNYDGCDFLEKGTWWFKQGHIFKNPFYYIDYTLAQICALQFWKKMNDNRELGWEDYMKLCSVGGTKSFLELVKLGNLKSPFGDGCVSSVIGNIDEYLESVDDSKL
jgi:M3 family oligoendopeptidase